jgi:hypothetical protein
MYMYSIGITHYFKHIKTREYINIVATLNHWEENRDE